MNNEMTAVWEKRFQNLKGRTIKHVRYMSDLERHEAGWASRAIVIQLDDGTLLIPQADDEGNDAGALGIQSPSATFKIAPVIQAPREGAFRLR